MVQCSGWLSLGELKESGPGEYKRAIYSALNGGV